jgi:hypothetical protein
MNSRLEQYKVIEEVLKFLSKKINTEYCIIEHPDEIQRNSPACDTIATIGTK